MKKTLGKFIAVAVIFNGLFGFSPAMAVTENAYRWRNDDGSEASATFLAAENTPLTTANIDLTKRLRFGAANNGTETELLKQASVSAPLGQDFYRTGVIDTAAGFAYFGLQTTPGQVTKVRLSDFTIVDTLVLPLGEDILNGAVIDTSGSTHYAYFITGNIPAMVIKIDLATFTRVGSITLPSGDGNGRRNGVIDTAAGFAYFPMQTSPAVIVKIDLATFTRVGAITLAAGENNGEVGVIDTAAGFAYFSTLTSPGRIVKIDLATFTRVGAITLASGQNSPASAVIDVAAGFAYFGTGTAPGRIVKVRLSDFTAVDTLTLPAGVGEDTLFSEAAIDIAAGKAYFSTFTSPSRIIKIDLATFTRDAAITLPTNRNNAWQLLIDTTGGSLYAGIYNAAGYIVKISLATFTETATLSPNGGASSLTAAAIDPAAGFAYFGTRTIPGKIVKVRLSDLSIVSTLTLPIGDDRFRAGVIDTAAGFAYFGTETIPAKVVKIDLSTFTKVSTLTLPTGEDNVRAGVIDTAAGFAYFGLNTSTGKVAKIRLSDFSHVGTMTLGAGEAGIGAAVIDATGPTHYMYVGTQQSLGKVAKIDLSTFTEVGTAITVSAGTFLASAVIDTANGFAYFGSQNNPGRVIRIDLSTFTETLPSILLNSGEAFLDSATIDTANGFAYFGTDNGGAVSNFLVKISLATFTRAAALPFAINEMTAPSQVIDPAKGHVYIGSFRSPGAIFKVSIAPKAEFRLEYGLKSTTCAAIGAWTQVPSVGVTEHWQMTSSLSVADGTATTNNAGLTDGNVAFQAGQFKSASAQTSEVSLGEKQFSELEYSIKPTEAAIVGQDYCFRLTNAGSATGFTYGQYAEATAAPKPTSGSGSCSFIIRPNGGEQLAAGQNYEITWSHSACQSSAVRLSLSTDGGATYPTIIADNEPEDGSYQWTVPNSPTTSAKVRLEALGAGNVVESSDASDGDFTILGSGAQPPPSPTTPPPPPPAPPSSSTYDPQEEQSRATSIDQDQGWQPSAGAKPCIVGSTFKAVSTRAVYYCGQDGKKHVFPNEKTYKTWYADFSHVLTMNDATVASILDGEPVTYKPGVRMVKITTDNKVYAVAQGGVLRWVTTEARAAQLYGTDWNTKIDDMAQSIFDTYTMGEPID